MTNRFKLFILFLMMVLTVVLTAYITYAWFTVSEKSKPIIITTGSIRQTASFWYGIDSDYDGVLDSPDEYRLIDKAGLKLSKIVPGQIHTFKIIVINDGTVDGNLSIKMNEVIADNEELLKHFILRYTNPTTNEVFEKTLNEILDDDNSFMMFDNYEISKRNGDANYMSFDFTLEASETIPNLKKINLLFTNFIITLVQLGIE